MGKFSILTAVEMLEEEVSIGKAVAFQIKKLSNPYWGLKCNRGLWLTRFPEGSLPRDPEFTMAFIEAGGGLDAMGHWGESPEHLRDLESQGWSHDEVALLAQKVPENLCQIEGVTPENYRVLQRGKARAEALKSMKIPYGGSDWTLGSKPLKWFLKKLFGGGLRVTSVEQNYPHHWFMLNYYVRYRPLFDAQTRGGDEYQVREALICEGVTNWDLSALPAEFLAYCRKCSKSKIKINGVDSTPIFSSLKVAKRFAEKANLRQHCNGVEWGKFWTEGFRTSDDTVMYHLHERLLFVPTKKGGYDEVTRQYSPYKIVGRQTYNIRNVAGWSVCKISGTWYVWLGNFSNHIEGYGSLKSAIELAEKRRKRSSLVLTFNDVRNDKPGTAGFCLAGTKYFLQNKMPFVYRMVAQYNNWAEIPEDIMSIEWHLASKDIFTGYSSPVN